MGFFSRKKKETFVCPMTGILHPIEEVPDPVFSEKSMGEGFAIELTGREVIAPLSGTITATFPTGHAYGITTKEGTEILIHIGLETVALNGAGFEIKKKQNDTVKQGDVLVTVDVDYLKEQGKSLYSPVIFTGGEKVELLKTGDVRAGDEDIIKIQ
ncbi:PTS system glucose-specific EIIA component [Eubacterium plexicaudatum ASF492]|uniref:PTS system, glucose subfamily, IIA component n=1 Tax=Eubacterium plexicaudatum ASF492 TaxID=1235802 RepID=N2B5Y4_9FIRM|nr:PTS system glucose-specific EIIA component [Eubacterium plexicaudatum ASF492]